MTSLTFTPDHLAAAPANETSRAPSPRKRPQGPVLIGDSLCPHGQGTLLLTLWRDWERSRDQD